MKTYKILFIIVLGILYLGKTNAQQVVNSKYTDLFDLFVMEDYENCLKKAEKYTKKDNTEKDSEPYLYISMCYYQIYLNKGNYDPEIYKYPLKDALSYAYQYSANDKKNREFDESNKSYLQELKNTGLKMAARYSKKRDYRKAVDFAIRTLKFNPDNESVMLMTGYYQLLSRNTSEGNKNIENALQSLKEKQQNAQLKLDIASRKILTDGFIKYSDMLEKSGNEPEAQAVIAAAKELLANNKEIIDQYKRLHN